MIYLVLISIFAYVNEAQKLNAPKILLPYRTGEMEEPVGFSLEVSGISGQECFRWNSSNSDAVIVEPVGDCAPRAIVKSVFRKRKRANSIILVQDIKTGLILNCDVIIDVIHTIEIQTTTRELYIDDAPERFVLIAKNDQNDTFSSLENLSFDWRLDYPSNAFHGNLHKILRLVKFFDSKYETTQNILSLESRHLMGDQVLLEGIGTGRARLTVEFKDSEYAAAHPSDYVLLTVIAHLMLSPSHDLRVIVGQTVNFTAFTLRQNRLIRVNIETDQLDESPYYLHSSDASVFAVDLDGTAATALKLGQAVISLKDKNDDSTSSHLPQLTVTVVNAELLQYSIKPGESNWILEKNSQYELQAELLDDHGEKIYIGQGLSFESRFDRSFFNVHFISDNQTYALFEPIVLGQTEINGRFGSLTCAQKVEIYDKLIVEPDLLVFPPIAGNSPRYKALLTAKGGSGRLVWSSTNQNVATVDSGAVVEIKDSVGSAQIFAVDAKNSLHRAYSIVVVSDLMAVEFGNLPSHIELNSDVHLSLTAFAEIELSAKRLVPFTDCSSLTVQLISPENSVKLINGDETRIDRHSGCKIVSLRASKLGSHDVTLLFPRLNMDPVSANLTFNVFPPLTVLDPTGDLFLMVGSSWNVRIFGGPRNEAKFQINVEKTENAIDDSLVVYNGVGKMNGRSNDETTIFTIFCQNAGSANVFFRAKMGSDIDFAASLASLKVVCDMPKRITVTPFFSDFDSGLKCPLTSGDKFPLHYKNPSRMQLSLFGEKNVKLLNISSSYVIWNLQYDSAQTFEEQVEIVEDFRFGTNSTSLFHIFTVVPRLGQLDKFATLRLSLPSVSDQSSIFGARHANEDSMVTSIDVHFVDFAHIDGRYQDTVRVFNHPENSITLPINSGSGHFYVAEYESESSALSIQLNTAGIKILPKSTTPLMTVHIVDLCLGREQGVVINITVSDMDRLVIDGPENVELGGTTILSLNLIDENGHSLLLCADCLNLLKIRFEFDDSTIGVSTLEASPIDSYSNEVQISGENLGVSKIVAIGYLGNKMVRSNEHSIQVFAPLILTPRRVNLVVGAKFQIKIKGGPQGVGSLNFATNDSEIVKINSIGLLEARKIGRVKIVGFFGDRKSSAFQKSSQDEVYINVVSLAKIRIQAASETIYNGSRLTLWAEGISKEGTVIDALSWTSAQPHFTFDWSLEQAGLLTNPVDSAAFLDNKNKYSVVFTGLRPCLATVTLKVTISSPRTKYSAHADHLTSKIQMEVVEPPSIQQKPNALDANILMAPDSAFNLNLNRKIEHVSLSALPSGLVNISSDGLLRATNSLGSGVIVGEVTIPTSHGQHKEYLAAALRVEQVAYLLLSKRNASHLQNRSAHLSDLYHLPTECSFEFDLTSYNSFGQRFDATDSKISIRPNRFDLADVTYNQNEDKLRLIYHEPGELSIKVWDKKHDLRTFLHIIGFNPIRTESTILNVGDIICLESALESQPAFESRLYSTADSAVLDVSSDYGVAIAKAAGEVVINHTPNEHCSPKLAFKVRSSDGLHFLDEKSPKNVASYGIYGDNVIEFPFKFGKTSRFVTSETCLTRIEHYERSGQNVKQFLRPPAICKFSYTDDSLRGIVHAEISTEFSTKFNAFICRLLLPKLAGSESALKISSLRSTINLSIEYASNGEHRVVEAEKSIDFYGPLVLRQKSLNLDNLEGVEKVVAINGPLVVLQSLRLSTNLDGILSIGRGKINSTTSVARFLIRLTKKGLLSRQKDVENLVVIISADITGQRIELPVNVKFYEEGYVRASTNFWGFLQRLIDLYGSMLLIFSTILATMFCVYVGYKIFVQNGYNDIISSGLQYFGARQIASSPMPSFSPGKGSPLVTGISPQRRSPNQTPYLWSVNRNRQKSPSRDSLSTSFNRFS